VKRSTLDEPWQRIDWTRHTQDLIVRGRRVRFVDIGSGPPVVLIHGQGGSWQFWLRSLPSMADGCRVIAVDLAGFGDSDPIADGDVFDEHVATIRDLMGELGLAKAVVVGHSMGGLVSIRFTCEHPDRVAGLALVDAGGSPMGPKRLALILAAFRVFNAVFGIRRISEFVARTGWLLKLLFAAAMGDRHSMSTDLGFHIFPRMASPGFIQTMEAAAVAVGEVTPERINHPTLVVWGVKDRILLASAGRELAARMPDASFVALDGVGHCPMIEAPAEFAALINDFAADPQWGRPAHAPDRSTTEISSASRARWWNRRRPRPMRDVS
jgi:pimeloyl-ACP methyl ester carboxylesterase